MLAQCATSRNKVGLAMNMSFRNVMGVCLNGSQSEGWISAWDAAGSPITASSMLALAAPTVPLELYGCDVHFPAYFPRVMMVNTNHMKLLICCQPVLFLRSLQELMVVGIIIRMHTLSRMCLHAFIVKAGQRRIMTF